MVLTAGALAAALAGAGAIGAVFFGPLAATAATSPSPSGTTAGATPAPGATLKSNEDPTHENGETQAQETAENNGTAHHGVPGGAGARAGMGSNEDPAHEKTESPAREQQEGTNQAPTASPSPSAQ